MKIIHTLCQRRPKNLPFSDMYDLMLVCSKEVPTNIHGLGGRWKIGGRLQSNVFP